MACETLLYAFHNNTLYKFERADRRTASWFGGPLRAEFSGQSFGPKPLHQIASVGCLHLPALSPTYIFELPLIFGMHYGGCELLYRLEEGRRVEVLRIEPVSSLDDWPYPNFPPLLPFVPLRLEDTPRAESYDEFARRFPNMPWPQPTELVCAVPPPATIGLSLWEDGDLNDVTIVFECDLKKKEVRSYTATS
jgi:hypothetical protein